MTNTPTPPRGRLAEIERALDIASALLDDKLRVIERIHGVVADDAQLVGNTLNDIRTALTILAEMRADMKALEDNGQFGETA